MIQYRQKHNLFGIVYHRQKEHIHHGHYLFLHGDKQLLKKNGYY